MNSLVRSLPSRPPRPLCHCRHAHLAPTPLAAASALPPPPPASTFDALDVADPYPAWSDPSYLARYRDPQAHDRLLTRSAPKAAAPTSRPTPRSASFSPPATPTPSSSSTARLSPTLRERKETPRSRRLEMERLWSGGEASPPIPLEHYSAASLQRPKHILAFPGSGSQYVGMGHFLREYPAASKVWDEAEDALAGFESWRKDLRLEDLEGEVGQLGRMLQSGEDARRRETGLKQVVFNGPQVRF